MEFKWQRKERERDRQAGKMKIFDHFKYILFCKDEQWWTPSNWCISNSLLRWISQKLLFRLKFWVFDLLNNQSVKNWLSRCLMANMALLENVLGLGEMFFWSNHDEALSGKRGWKDGWLPLEALGTQSAVASSSPAGRLVCKSRDDLCWWLTATIWVMALGPSAGALCVHSLPQSWRQESGPRRLHGSSVQSRRSGRPGPVGWSMLGPFSALGVQPGWRRGLPSPRKQPPPKPKRDPATRGWRLPTWGCGACLWAAAGARRMKVSPGEGKGNTPLGHGCDFRLGAPSSTAALVYF